jgi:hypothetical protein
MVTSWTASDIAKLERAIRLGARRVTYGDNRSVEYRSLEDMVRTLELVKGALGQSELPLRKVMATGKGLRIPDGNAGDFTP